MTVINIILGFVLFPIVVVAAWFANLFYQSRMVVKHGRCPRCFTSGSVDMDIIGSYRCENCGQEGQL